MQTFVKISVPLTCSNTIIKNDYNNIFQFENEHYHSLK